MVEQMHGFRLDEVADVGRLLKGRREHAGLTLRTLSVRAGLSHSALGRWESGGTMTAWSLFEWAHALGCDIALVPRSSA